MSDVKNILEGLWSSLFVLLPSDITIFLVSILGIVLAVVLLRVVLGG